ncbi:hypothetical protein [Albidovulum sp.]|uniref:hypothetical protein n=1 Tax=Albidovulum sp. TaxID=1872424 RepID=UPI0039B92D32
MQAGGDPGGAVPLLSEALRLLSGAGAVPSDLWIGASGLLARLDLDAGRAAAARARAEEFMRIARPTEWRARAAASAADIRFRLGDFADAATLLEEALAVDPGTLSQVYGDLFVAYAAAQEAAEAEGRIDDAAALIDARLAILRTFAVDPDDAGKRRFCSGSSTCSTRRRATGRRPRRSGPGPRPGNRPRTSGRSSTGWRA